MKIKLPKIKIKNFLKKLSKKEKGEAKSASSEEDTKLKINLPQNYLKIIVLGISGLVLVFLVTISILIYGTKNESPFVAGTTKVLPFPAEIIGGRFVLMKDYYEQLDILKNYYKNFQGIDFNSPEGKLKLEEIKKDTKSRLTEDAIVAIEAKKLKIAISREDLNNSYNELVKSNGGVKAFSEILNKFYGLSAEEFKDKIYRPRMLREKLAEKINSEETVTGAAKKKADEVYDKLKGGANFAQLAKEYSQDAATAANGGDLGFFGKGKMVPAFEEAAFALKVGEYSEPVRTVYGYHIIKVTEKKGNEIRASHILIKVRDFNEWLSEKKEEYKKKKIWGIFPAYLDLYPIK